VRPKETSKETRNLQLFQDESISSLSWPKIGRSLFDEILERGSFFSGGLKRAVIQRADFGQ
jgi:hypothetical protein